MLLEVCAVALLDVLKYTYILHDGLFLGKRLFVDGRLLLQFSCEVEAVPVAFEMGPMRRGVGEGAAAGVAR